jgi:cell division transport system permease protein
MSSKFDSYHKRRLQSSYISVVISIALVLFMVGFLGLILLKSTKVANHIKEKVAITLFVKDKVTQKQIKTFRESLLEEEFTKNAVYTSKEQAAEKYSEEIGEDFLEFLGENPLKNGIDIYLKADYVTPEKMQELETRFLENAFVADVSYDKPLINLLTKNIKRVSFW